MEFMRLIFEIIGYFASIVGLYLGILQSINMFGNKISWNEIESPLNRLSMSIMEEGTNYDYIAAIGKGGASIAGMLSAKLKYLPIFHFDRQEKFRKDGSANGFDIISYGMPDISNKNILLVNGDSNTGQAFMDSIVLLKMGKPNNIKTASLIRLDENNKENKKVSYSPHFYGKVLKKTHILPWEKEDKKRASSV